MLRTTMVLGLLAVLTLALPGCGGGLASVQGKVTYDGDALDTGTVQFHPVGDGPVAYGQIQPDGTYRIKTGTESGVAPGEYRVSVTADAPVTEALNPDGSEALPESLIPDKYRSPATSGLTFTVPSDEGYDIALVSE
jgi:hypothetical protein